jgi:hypothetical protein
MKNSWSFMVIHVRIKMAFTAKDAVGAFCIGHFVIEGLR